MNEALYGAIGLVVGLWTGYLTCRIPHARLIKAQRGLIEALRERVDLLDDQLLKAAMKGKTK